MKENARDPYVGLNEYFGRKASEAVPSWYAVGKVLATSPLKIRADGLDLDLEDLFIAQHLTAGWQEQLTGLSWPLTAELPQKAFQGTCTCGLSSGTCQVIRPEETVEGKTARKPLSLMVPFCMRAIRFCCSAPQTGRPTMWLRGW